MPSLVLLLWVLMVPLLLALVDEHAHDGVAGSVLGILVPSVGAAISAYHLLFGQAASGVVGVVVSYHSRFCTPPGRCPGPPLVVSGSSPVFSTLVSWIAVQTLWPFLVFRISH